MRWIRALSSARDRLRFRGLAGRKARGDRPLGVRAYGLWRSDPGDRAGERDVEFPVKWGIDLQSEHERYLTEKYAKKPVVVMNYPKAIKAFYMWVSDDGFSL